MGLVIVASYWKIKVSNALFYLMILQACLTECIPINYGEIGLYYVTLRRWQIIIQYTSGHFYSEIISLCHSSVFVALGVHLIIDEE